MRRREFLDYEFVNRLLDEHRRKQGLGFHLWALLNLIYGMSAGSIVVDGNGGRGHGLMGDGCGEERVMGLCETMGDGRR